MNFKKQKNFTVLNYGNQKLRISILNDRVIRITHLGNGVDEPQKSYMVENQDSFYSDFEIEENSDGVFIKTQNIKICINENIPSITFINEYNKIILQEIIEKLLQTTPVSTFKVNETTQFYGLGQQQKGVVGYKGTKVEIKHENTTIAIPFLLTNEGYGILWDNNGRTWADFTENDTMSFESETGNVVDYYFIYGPSMNDIIQRYWELTGPAPMIPKYAFGFWQSKMRYMSQDELIGVAEKYRQKQYPVDISVIDFYHWTEMGDFKFDPEAWPDPEGMFKKLKELHIQGVVSIWPYISEKSSNFDSMDKNDMFVKDNKGNTIKFTIFNGEKSGLYDPFNPEARKHIWEKAKAYYDQGAKIWWLDSCEPDDGLNIENLRKTGINTIDGPLDDRINAYALMHERAFYEGMLANDMNKRVLILARAASAGCQRYGVTVWSGDVGYDFKALKSQIIAGLNATMSGLPFWTTDIGGFRGGDPKDPAYRELYIRWFQFGAFCPLFRVHGSRGATSMDDLIYGISRGENEIWSFGDELEKIMVQYDKLRYRMIPYIYSCAKKTIDTGKPLMRALVIDFISDAKAVAVTDQFMFGTAIMVCPVVEEGVKSRKVYLPEGTDWYDYHTNQKYTGGQTIEANAPIDMIPLFVKAGSIIPMGPEIQFVGQIEKPEISLSVYVGNDAEFDLYDDDGYTFNYREGEFCLLKLYWNEKDRKITEKDVNENKEMYFHKEFNMMVIGLEE